MPGDSYAGIKPKGKIQFQLEDVGSWNVSGEFGQQTVSQPIIVSFPNETINVSLSFNESVLYVSSPLGAIITVSNGNETLTSVSTGQNSFTLYSFGNWTVSGQINGGNLTTSTVYVQPGNSYQVQLKIMAANLIVSGRENMQVTVTGEDFSKTEQIKNGNCVFQISQFGTYSITGVLGGLNATPMSVNVQSYQNYTISLQISVINIIVSAPEGAIITAKNGNNVLTASVQSGQATFVTQVIGLWEITGSLNGFSLSSSSLNISEYGNYHVELFILTATLTVTTPQGTLVTVQGGGEEQTLPATNGTATFQLSQLGKYSVSGSLNGLESDTQVIQIDQFQEYTLALTILYATITVFAPENTEITLTNGSKQLNGTATDGNAVFNVQATGNWTVSGVLEGYTFADKTVNVTNIQGDYSTTLSPLYATITVTAPNETEVVAESASGEQVYGYVNGSSVELKVYQLGAWTVSGTQGNLTSNSVSVQVSDWTNYQVTLTIWVATITVTAPTGIQVTAENGATSLQQTAANNQTVFSVQQTGTWTLSAQFDTQSDSTTVNVQAEQDYPARLWVPTVVPTVVTGSSVTCTQGQTVLAKTSQNGQVRFYVPTLGEWTVNATLNQQTSNTVIVDVQEDRDYPLLLNYTFATITVATVAGTEVTAQNGSISTIQYANDDGEAVFEIATFGTWTLSASFDEELITVEVLVEEFINYNVEILPTPTTPEYVGTITPLSQARQRLAATSVGNYALFGGGYGNSTYFDIVDAYNSSFTSTIAAPLSKARDQLAATSVGNYALFGGGYGNTSFFNIVDVYSDALTKTIATPLSQARRNLTATSVGDYALFGGGYYNSSGVGQSSAVDAYNNSLTKTIVSSFEYKTGYLAAATIGDYALFGGGYNGSSYSNVVTAYNSSLTKTNAASLSQARQRLAATSVGNYALFGGGYGSSLYTSVVDAYNSSLTRMTATPLSQARQNFAATSVNNFALFGGGSSNTYPSIFNTVDSYNKNLTRTIATPLSQARTELAATSVGNYALFGGGLYGDPINNVDVYS